MYRLQSSGEIERQKKVNVGECVIVKWQINKEKNN